MRMPDFRPDNQPISLGLAVKELLELGVAPENIDFSIDLQPASMAEMCSQSPAPSTSLDGSTKITLTVNSDYVPPINFEELVDSLLMQLSFSGTLLVGLTRFFRLIEELQRQLPAPSVFRAQIDVFYQDFFSNTQHAGRIEYVLNDLFEPLFYIDGHTVKIELLDLDQDTAYTWYTSHFDIVWAIFRCKPFLFFLKDYFNFQAHASFQDKERRFRFLTSAELDYASYKLAPWRKQLLTSYLSYYLYLFAKIDIAGTVRHHGLVSNIQKKSFLRSYVFVRSKVEEQSSEFEELLLDLEFVAELSVDMLKRSYQIFSFEYFSQLLVKYLSSVDADGIRVYMVAGRYEVVFNQNMISIDWFKAQLLKHLFVPIHIPLAFKKSGGGHGGFQLGIEGRNKVGLNILY